MKYCQNCGYELYPDDITCPRCGQDVVPTKFCKHCGEKIDVRCVVCTKCGMQVETMDANQQYQQPPIIINNTNTNTNINDNDLFVGGMYGRPINKWVAFALCLFLGFFGAHKFYEGKIGIGILYLVTFGLFGIGWIIDIFLILMKPNPYYI